MLFASKQKLNQMTDAALESRKGAMGIAKIIGLAMVTAGGTGGAFAGGAIALFAGASKIGVVVAFVGGAVLPIVAGIAVAVMAGAAVSRIESVMGSRPRPAAAKKQPKAEPAPATAPALANAPDLSDDFHAGVNGSVATMKPLKLKSRPEQQRVM